jgi:hypothetical protein
MSEFTFYHATGTGDNSGDFLQYWKDNYKNSSKCTTCCMKGCDSKKDLEGAHVHKSGSCEAGSNRHMYILQLCHKCNTNKETSKLIDL